MQSYDFVIIGKGSSGLDVIAVQKAVDQVGSILLKGTFSFEEKGRVSITKGININGETDTQGSPLTKIQGGFGLFTAHYQLSCRHQHQARRSEFRLSMLRALFDLQSLWPIAAAPI